MQTPPPQSERARKKKVEKWRGKSFLFVHCTKKKKKVMAAKCHLSQVFWRVSVYEGGHGTTQCEAELMTAELFTLTEVWDNSLTD